MNRFLRISVGMTGKVAAVALVLAATASAQAAGGTLHYLTAGVSRYPLLSAENQLRFAHKDALDIAALCRAQAGGLYARAQGDCLTDAQATRQGIEAALARLAGRVGPGDTVLVSLSGHGGTRGGWFFLPSDFDPANPHQTGLPAEVLRARLAETVRRGANVVLVIDACHAGAVGIQEPGVVVFASSLPGQFSYESPVRGNGIFTCALLEALRGRADANGDGVITLAEADAYVSARVEVLLREMPARPGAARRDQHPTCARPPSVRSSLPLAANSGPSLTGQLSGAGSATTATTPAAVPQATMPPY
jgi:uncharacterized caspase-like protein